MRTHSMNHQQAVNEHATERYLLREMNAEERRAFEEHYLDCADCLEAVTFGAEFLDAGRQIAPEMSARSAVRVPSWRERLLPAVSGWFRPVPALAFALLLCLGGIAYQANTIHRQQNKIASLQDLRPDFRFLLTGETRGEARIIRVPRNAQLSIEVEFTPGAEYTPYRADLLSDNEKLKYSMPLSVGPNQDSISFSIPAAQLDAGNYSVIIRRENKAGASKDLASKFVLQFID
ncbi:MAG TPA: zf-HC2 domain-containing protein [Candidatus Angelobacter sp.]|nr:zf-HC2 domain-containing protein [Candidatus Angelobacter sp.]